MEDKSFIETMELIVSALRERGYDPYSQIYGYLKENEPTYITSHNGARDLIQELDIEQVKSYLARMEQGRKWSYYLSNDFSRGLTVTIYITKPEKSSKL